MKTKGKKIPTPAIPTAALSRRLQAAMAELARLAAGCDGFTPGCGLPSHAQIKGAVGSSLIELQMLQCELDHICLRQEGRQS